MKVFLWSIIQKALPLGDNLQSRGVQSAGLCVRCKEKETAVHTFFNCAFAQEVWKLIPLHQVVHLATSSDFREIVIKFRRSVCLPPTGISGSILPWICWVIWNARNLVIFENRTLSAREVATKGLRLAREWNNAQGSIKKTTKTVPRRPATESTQESHGTIVTCKTDAAWNKSTNKAGLGWAISDPTHQRSNKGTAVQDFVKSPLIAEALALRLGLIAAVNLDVDRIRMLSDNSTLIRAIKNDMQIKEIFGIVQDIQAIVSVSVDISFSFISRSLNTEADDLAKKAFRDPSIVNPAMG